MSEAMLFAEGLLSKQQVVEDFGIPEDLEPKLFAILRPRVGQLFYKKDVEKVLEKVLGFAGRDYSIETEGLQLSGVGPPAGLDGPWNRIAESLEQLVRAILPKTSTVDANPNDICYTTSEAAELMNRHVDVVREYCRKGVFGTRDASGKWVIRHSEIEKFRIGQLLVRGKGVA